MSVKIRLKRIGRKKQPSYRVVVMDTRSPRGGKVIEEVGSYSPYRKNKPMDLKLDRIEEWRSKGAKPSEAVIKLLKKARKGAVEPAAEPKPVKAVDPVETPASEAEVEAATEVAESTEETGEDSAES